MTHPKAGVDFFAENANGDWVSRCYFRILDEGGLSWSAGVDADDFFYGRFGAAIGR